MKKYRILLLAITGLLFHTACEDDIEKTVLAENITTPIILSPASGASYTLLEANQNDTLFKLSWSEADFGPQLAITYVVEMDSAIGDFSDPIELARTLNTEVSFTVREMNTRMLIAGGVAGESTDMSIRIRAIVNPGVDPVFSTPITFAITPFATAIAYPMLFVSGNFQAASGYGTDWTPDLAANVYSVLSNNMFEGYIFFNVAAPEFKFTEGLNWDVNWGDDGANLSLDSAGANILLPVGGYYRVNVNLVAMTYAVVLTDWGLIGSATTGAWNTSTPMTYNLTTKVWEVTTNLTAGEIKFRANNAWTINLGDHGNDGTLEYDGANIAIAEAGSYTIRLNLSGPIYTFSLTRN